MRMAFSDGAVLKPRASAATRTCAFRKAFSYGSTTAARSLERLGLKGQQSCRLLLGHFRRDHSESGPSVPHTHRQLILPSFHPRRIVFFSDFYAGMTQQHGYLIDGNAGEQHLDGERISQHVREAAFRRPVRPFQPRKFEESSETSWPVSHSTLRKAVSAPEEISRIWLYSFRHGTKRFSHLRREGNVYGCPSLCLIEQEIVVDEPCAFQRNRIADTQSTPAHEHQQRAKASSIGGSRFPAVLPVAIGCIEQFLVLLTREVVRGRLRY